MKTIKCSRCGKEEEVTKERISQSPLVDKQLWEKFKDKVAHNNNINEAIVYVENWLNLEGYILCPECSNSFGVLLNKFMNELK